MIGQFTTTEDRGNQARKLNRVLDLIQGATGSLAGTGVSAATSAGGKKTVLTLNNVAIDMTDADTAGTHGSLKVFTFPAGNLLFMGASCNLALVAGEGGLTDTAAVVGGLGTAAVGTDNATLTTTEQNLIPSTASTLSGGEGATANVSATANIAAFDGSSSAVEAYLNFAAPDAGSTADDTLTVSGTITLYWDVV